LFDSGKFNLSTFWKSNSLILLFLLTIFDAFLFHLLLLKGEIKKIYFFRIYFFKKATAFSLLVILDK